MKKILTSMVLFAASAVIFVSYCSADEGKADKSDKKADSEILSAKEISELKSEFTDPKTQKKYKWIGKFQLDNSRAAKAKAKLSKKAAYRITGSLYEMKSIGSRVVSARQSGKCRILITDAEGKTVLKATRELDSMCPS